MGGTCCRPVSELSKAEELGADEAATTDSCSSDEPMSSDLDSPEAKAAREGIACLRELLDEGVYSPASTANFEHKVLAGILMRDVYNLFDSHLGMHLAPEILGTEPKHPARSYMPILYNKLLRSGKLSPEWEQAVRYMKSITPRESLNRLAHMFTEELPGESIVVLAGKEELIEFVISGLPAEREHRVIFDLCASYPPVPRPLGFTNRRDPPLLPPTSSGTHEKDLKEEAMVEPTRSDAHRRQRPTGRSRSPRRTSPKREALQA